MNERIENLMYHAGLTARGCWDSMDEYDKAAIEKFSELLIRECIYIVSPYAIRMENFDGGHPITDLKKHFGVKDD